MADFDYSQDGATLGEYMKDTLSPFDDPDEARLNQAAALASINGESGEPGGGGPKDQTQTPAAVPASSGFGTGRYSNGDGTGNELPPKLYSRANPTNTPDRVPAASAQVAPLSGADQSQVSPTSTAGGAAPSWADYARRGLGSLATNMDKASTTADQDAQAQTLEQENSLLQQRFDAASQPVNPYMPGTNQVQKQYKVGIGSKILRGLEGAAEGVAKGGAIGGIVGAIDPRVTAGEGKGYGDPNSSYYQDVADRKAQAAAAAAQIDQNNKMYPLQTSRMAQVTAARTAALNAGKDLSGAATAEQNADSTAQQVQQQSPEAKVDALTRIVQARKAIGLQIGLKGAALSRYAVTGEDPQPPRGEVPSAELQQYVDWRRATTAANGGRPPTAAQLEEYRQRGGSGEDKSPRAQAILNDANTKRDEFVNQWVPDGKGGYRSTDFTKTMSAAEYQAKANQYAQDANVKLAPLGYSVGPTGELVPVGSKAAPAAAPVAGGAAAPPPAVLPPPTAAIFDSRAWLRAHPGGNVRAAKAKAARLGYTVR